VVDKITCPVLITSKQKGDYMADRRVAIVIGANQGIGLQIAKDLVAHGFTVWLERAVSSAARLRPRQSTVTRALQLDVTDKASIAAAAERIQGACLGDTRARG
jgi:NAD(P)-dependent dehydrogenase (short-subunit alcohol dehydrogenase family)